MMVHSQHYKHDNWHAERNLHTPLSAVEPSLVPNNSINSFSSINLNKSHSNNTVSTGSIKNYSNPTLGNSIQIPPPTPSVPVDELCRPKHLAHWTNADVMKWLKRHCHDYYMEYKDLFQLHEITGRTLCRVTDLMLERMGIMHTDHRDELCRVIIKLKLKSDMLELRDLERQGSGLASTQAGPRPTI